MSNGRSLTGCRGLRAQPAKCRGCVRSLTPSPPGASCMTGPAWPVLPVQEACSPSSPPFPPCPPPSPPGRTSRSPVWPGPGGKVVAGGRADICSHLNPASSPGYGLLWLAKGGQHAGLKHTTWRDQNYPVPVPVIYPSCSIRATVRDKTVCFNTTFHTLH